MEASSSEVFSEADKYGYENEEAVMYLTKEKQRAQSPSLARHAVPSSKAEELDQHIKVGSFYEVDHSKLPHKSPEQLYSIRVVMVSEKNTHGASLRFPSVHSLRAHFSDESYGEPEGKKLPALDEKYVMGSDIAAQVLFRRIPPQEMAERGNFWSFWSPPSLPSERNGSSSDVVSKRGSCWSQLRFSGMIQWGKRRQVRFLNRHEEHKHDALAGSGVSSDDEKKEEEDEAEEGKGKEVEESAEEDGKEEEEETVDVVKKRRCSKRKLQGKNESKAESSKRAKRLKENERVNTRSKKNSLIRNSIERWSTARYKLAEENMLKIMKAKGAFFGNPILRPALRNEARKLIGDTGLLDHLLKHMAGKVAPGGADRFRRRHNSDGAMEYWIESADLVNIRRQAGVQDPYWTPPPGWKPGDNPTQDPVSAREIESLKKEITKIKKIIQELVSKQEEEAASMREYKQIKEEMGKMKRVLEELIAVNKHKEDLSIVLQPNSTLSVECDYESSLPLTEKMHRKPEIEELLEISQRLREMEENMRLKSEGVLSDMENKRQKNISTTTKSGDVQQGEDQLGGDKAATEDKATRIQRLKSGFRICKPQGSFLWPDKLTLSQTTCETVVLYPENDHDHPLVVATPPSVSSTSAPPCHLIFQTPHPHTGSHPLSPVKPLAEKRPVRPTTLCTVSKGSDSSSSASIPPPPKTPNSQNINIFNLNEAPIDQNTNDGAMSSLVLEEQETKG